MIIQVGKKYWTSDEKSIIEIVAVSDNDDEGNEGKVFYNRDGIRFNMDGVSIDYGDDLVEEYEEDEEPIPTPTKVDLVKKEIVQDNMFTLADAKKSYSTLIDRMMEVVYKEIKSAVFKGRTQINLSIMQYSLASFEYSDVNKSKIIDRLSKNGYVIIQHKDDYIIKGWADE